MQHARPHSFAGSIMWRSLAALLVGCILAPSPAISSEMYRWSDEQGRVHLTDTPPRVRGALQEMKVYPPSIREPSSESGGPSVAGPGRVKMTPTKPGGTVVVDVLVNRRLTVPMLLDTGADFTVLTRQMARDLHLAGLHRLPTQEFKTAGGAVRLPIATVQSLRVGTAEARDVEVAIDIDGHMTVGLLGMTFLRHFKVTVDHQHGHITFAR